MGGEPASCCPPAHHDFASLPNVVMSPHRGGAPSVAEVEERRYEELEKVVRGVQEQGWQSLHSHPNLYSLKAGY